MKNCNLLALFFVLIIGLVLSGCVRIDIGDRVKQPTLADQLTDLIAVKDTGKVSDKEFEKLKKKLLDSF